MVEIEKAHESLELLGLKVGSQILEAKLEEAAKGIHLSDLPFRSSK